MMPAPVLVLDPEGSGATRWHDCTPGRADLPRTLADMPVLGVTPLEHDDPSLPGWHFRRTPRPGQGRLSPHETTGLCIVLISPKHDTPAGAQALRDWGDFVHIAHIAATGVPGYTMITPYEITSRSGTPRYLHLYEMDGDDPEACFQAMTPLVRERRFAGDEERFRDWAWHPELRIDFVSTFRRAS